MRHSALWLAALAGALLAAPPLLAQSTIESRLASLRDGNLHFTYATRATVCRGDSYRIGDREYGTSWTNVGADRTMGECSWRPVLATVERSNGATTRLRVLPMRDGALPSDVVRVSAADAAQYLMTQARTLGGEDANQALLGAVVADSVALWPALAALASDTDASRHARSTAIYFITSYDTAPARGTLRTLATTESLGTEYRKAAIIALGSATRDPADLAWLERQFDTLPAAYRDVVLLAVAQSDAPAAATWLGAVATDESRPMHDRKQALFWLGQSHAPSSDLVGIDPRLTGSELRRHYAFVLSQRHDDSAVAKLIDVARSDRDADVRKQALFWLGQSHDPRALAFIRSLVLR